MTAEDIYAEAMALPNDSKADIVDRLLADIVSHIDPEIESAQIATAKRRRDEIRSGAVEAVPGEEALARVRSILRR